MRSFPFLLVAALFASNPAAAWSDKPVRFIVLAPPGGASPAQLERAVRADYERNAAIVKAFNITFD